MGRWVVHDFPKIPGWVGWGGVGGGADNTSPSDETPFVASDLVGKGADEMKNGATGGWRRK